MSAPYHPYVFDTASRRFVGDFEGMYMAGRSEGFSAWHQDDLTHPVKRIALSLLHGCAYRTAIDLGCGQGAFTHMLWRRGGDVLGLDVSPTAIDIAAQRYPHIRFAVHDLAADPSPPEHADLVVAMEVLSYLENWRDVLPRAAEACSLLLVSLWLPPDPIGFVGSHEELMAELERYVTVVSKLVLDDRTLIVLGGSR